MSIKKLWTAQEKRDFVAEYEARPHRYKTQLLAERGVSAHQIRDWRASRDVGTLEFGVTPRTRPVSSRAESAEIGRLRGEVERLEAELARARQDVDDRQKAVEALGKATALLHELVSGKSAVEPCPPAPSNDTESS